MAEIDRLIAFTYEMPADILRTVANTFPGFYTKEEVESLF
jgi:hypothetical protein